MDELIVLRSDKRLAKRITMGPPLKVEGYANAHVFGWEARRIGDLWDLAGELESLGADPNACVIRGQIRPHAEASQRVNRCVHVQSDGRQPDWQPATPGRRWVAFDFDKQALPKALRPRRKAPVHAEVVEMVRHVRSGLPEPFSAASCVYRLSASAGLEGWSHVSMHLWFWLSRPVYDLSWRAWAAGRDIDPALFRAVQPHYTAAPVFADGEDPLLGLRFGVLEDGPTEAEVPAELADISGWLAAEAERLDRDRKAIQERREAIVGGLGEQRPSAARAYALKALGGAVDDVLGAPVGNRHGTLVTKAYKLGGYCQDGFLSEAEVTEALSQAVAIVFPGPRHKEELRAVREMVAAGAEHPLDLSHLGRQQAPPPRLRVVPPPEDDDAPAPQPREAVARKAKRQSAGVEWVDLGEKGAILPTAANLAALMDWMGYRARRNLMSHQTEWEGAPNDIARECQQTAMAAVLLDEASRHGWNLAEGTFWRGLAAVEARRAYHPVAEWAASKPWDGKGRFGELFQTLRIRSGFEDFESLMRVQMERWLIAGGRCLALGGNSAEGVAVQGVLVLQGRQDIGKTRWFRSLVPDASWVAEGVTLDPSNKDSVIAATSSFIVELGELDATTKKSDVAQLKSFLTRAVDEYRAPYARKSEVYPRRTIFGGSVNPDEFLVDPTGNRRFWLMPVEYVNPRHGIDMQQIWAEATHRARAGEPYWMPDEHKAAQLDLAAKFQTRSEWADDFWFHFRLPVGDEPGTRYRLSEVRDIMYPERRWSQSEMRSFGMFVRGTGAKCDIGRNVLHARLVRT